MQSTAFVHSEKERFALRRKKEEAKRNVHQELGWTDGPLWKNEDKFHYDRSPIPRISSRQQKNEDDELRPSKYANILFLVEHTSRSRAWA